MERYAVKHAACRLRAGSEYWIHRWNWCQRARSAREVEYFHTREFLYSHLNLYTSKDIKQELYISIYIYNYSCIRVTGERRYTINPPADSYTWGTIWQAGVATSYLIRTGNNPIFRQNLEMNFLLSRALYGSCDVCERE